MATKTALVSVVEKDGQGNQDPDGAWLVREKLASSIKEKLSKLPPNPTGYCIYKVPERLKANNKDAFAPYVVSIGPFHHKDPRLKTMEDCKLRWLREIFKEDNSDVFAAVDFVARNEATIRRHYEDLGEISSEEFCEMILLDSIFILGLLLGKQFEKELTEFDILHDMMLIENQLPLFIPRTTYILSGGTKEKFNDLVSEYLFRLLDHTTTTSSEAPTQGRGDSDHASQLSPPNQSGPAHTSGVPTQPQEDSDVTQLSPPIQSEAAHFIEFLWMSYFDMNREERSPLEGFCSNNMEQLESGTPGTQQRQSKSTLCSWFSFSAKILECLCFCCSYSAKSHRSAEELYEAGVKFSPRKGGRNLNNIEFEGGVLKIPPIRVNELTETLLVNLIAFEQCKRLRTKEVCDYIVFMVSLIDTPKDVDILSDAQIIKISLRDSAWVANLFNDLYRENISDRKSVYDGILEDLKKYNKDPWHQFKAMWYKWKVMLPIAAYAITVLTVIQTACSIISLPMSK